MHAQKTELDLFCTTTDRQPCDLVATFENLTVHAQKTGLDLFCTTIYRQPCCDLVATFVKSYRDLCNLSAIAIFSRRGMVASSVGPGLKILSLDHDVGKPVLVYVCVYMFVWGGRPGFAQNQPA